MSEITTEYIRVAITVSLLGALIAIVLDITSVSLSYFYSTTNKFVNTIQDSAGYSPMEISNSNSNVSAPMLYRVIKENSEKIDSLLIRYKGNVVTNNCETLLSNTSKFLSCTITSVNGRYTIIAEEVM